LGEYSLLGFRNNEKYDEEGEHVKTGVESKGFTLSVSFPFQDLMSRTETRTSSRLQSRQKWWERQAQSTSNGIVDANGKGRAKFTMRQRKRLAKVD
jgi:hypothetical protein